MASTNERPDDALTVREAMNRIGLMMFADQWPGKEYLDHWRLGLNPWPTTKLRGMEAVRELLKLVWDERVIVEVEIEPEKYEPPPASQWPHRIYRQRPHDPGTADAGAGCHRVHRRGGEGICADRPGHRPAHGGAAWLTATRWPSASPPRWTIPPGMSGSIPRHRICIQPVIALRRSNALINRSVGAGEVSTACKNASVSRRSSFMHSRLVSRDCG